MDIEKSIEQLNDWNEKYISNLRGDRTIKCEEYCIKDDGLIVKAATALSALRPVSREQVEKVWRGCEKCNGAGEYSRYAENLTKTLLAKYCPHCGRPLTDEAVEMMLKRMEEIYK